MEAVRLFGTHSERERDRSTYKTGPLVERSHPAINAGASLITGSIDE
jgi:hypothetical protein